jgi:hypothetical protein
MLRQYPNSKRPKLRALFLPDFGVGEGEFLLNRKIGASVLMRTPLGLFSHLFCVWKKKHGVSLNALHDHPPPLQMAGFR